MQNILKEAFFILMVGIALTLTSCGNDSSIDNNNNLQVITESIRSALELEIGKTVPSMSVLIQTPSGIYFASSTASGEKNITPDTTFRFASNTKNFTAAAILNMYEDGWLDYKAKITGMIPGSAITYTPDTPEWNIPNKSDITIELLLQHSAGVYDVDNDPVPGYGGLSYVHYIMNSDPEHQFNSTELVNQTVIHKLSYFTPGNGYHYSNTGYTILGEIIARVYSLHAGATKTYTDYLHDYIFGEYSRVPLPIHFPHLSTDKALPEPYVCGRIINPQHWEFALNCQSNMSAHTAEGSGYGTMRALNTYIRTLMRGENVLQPSSVSLMQTNVSPKNHQYALGTIHETNMGYGHNGAIRGYLSYMLYNPEDDVSVITMMPMWDGSNEASFITSFKAVINLTSEARKALGFQGKP